MLSYTISTLAITGFLACYIKLVMRDIKEEKRQRGQRRRWQDTLERVDNKEKRKL